MRRFLIAHWTLPASIITWATAAILAAAQQQAIFAVLAAAALVCVCGMAWNAWRQHMLNARTTAITAGHAIQPAPVQRDSEGYWTHPAHPAFQESQHAEAHAWVDAQRLETSIAYLESEAEDHPAVVAYWGDAGDSNISAWEPPRPEGEGWFVLSIHDTEDWGPVCIWVRRAAQQGEGSE